MLALLTWFGLEGDACRAVQPAEVVYLGPSRQWRVRCFQQEKVCVLGRELIRQAFLMAARDELGLATRDAVLGDAMPTQGDNAPWDFTATPGEPSVAEVIHGFAQNQARFARHEIRCAGWVDYIALTEAEEKLSRTQYAETLKQARYAVRPVRADKSLAVPENVERLLQEMNFVSQFHALRELHGIVRSQGET